MDEIFEIQENNAYNNYLPSNLLNQEAFETPHGHYHNNDIDEIKKWIEDKFNDNLNITIDELIKVYDDNKSFFHIFINYFLISMMVACVFLLFRTILTVITKQRYMNQLNNIKKQISAQIKPNNKRKAE